MNKILQLPVCVWGWKSFKSTMYSASEMKMKQHHNGNSDWFQFF